MRRRTILLVLALFTTVLAGCGDGLTDSERNALASSARADSSVAFAGWVQWLQVTATDRPRGVMPVANESARSMYASVIHRLTLARNEALRTSDPIALARIDGYLAQTRAKLREGEIQLAFALEQHAAQIGAAASALRGPGPAAAPTSRPPASTGTDQPVVTPAQTSPVRPSNAGPFDDLRNKP